MAAVKRLSGFLLHVTLTARLTVAEPLLLGPITANMVKDGAAANVGRLM
jgi:hypothetical protein